MKIYIGFFIVAVFLSSLSALAQTYRESDPNVAVETMHRIDIKVEKLRTGGYRISPSLQHYQETAEDNKQVETMIDMGAIIGRKLFCDVLDENCLSARNIIDAK